MQHTQIYKNEKLNNICKICVERVEGSKLREEKGDLEEYSNSGKHRRNNDTPTRCAKENVETTLRTSSLSR